MQTSSNISGHWNLAAPSLSPTAKQVSSAVQTRRGLMRPDGTVHCFAAFESRAVTSKPQREGMMGQHIASTQWQQSFFSLIRYDKRAKININRLPFSMNFIQTWLSIIPECLLLWLKKKTIWKMLWSYFKMWGNGASYIRESDLHVQEKHSLWLPRFLL